MKISGFTFLRNATLMGYPFVESIKSLLPLVDEYVVNVGDSEDDTYERVAEIEDSKIRILHSKWNDKMQQKGFVYAQQKMIAQYNCTGDWAFYLEGDEIVHEQDIEKIRGTLLANIDNQKVEALAFHYHHFYGTPNQVAISPAWYRNEVRIIRNTIRSYAPDGLYWLVPANNHRKQRYPFAVHTGATIYHYGWVRSSSKMLEKFKRVGQYWNDPFLESINYGNIDRLALRQFTGTHPEVVQDWLATEAEADFQLNSEYNLSSREKKHRLLMQIEELFDWDLSKKHYKLLS